MRGAAFSPNFGSANMSTCLTRETKILEPQCAVASSSVPSNKTHRSIQRCVVNVAVSLSVLAPWARGWKQPQYMIVIAWPTRSRARQYGGTRQCCFTVGVLVLCAAGAITTPSASTVDSSLTPEAEPKVCS